jgi:hypothetical protein
MSPAWYVTMRPPKGGSGVCQYPAPGPAAATVVSVPRSDADPAAAAGVTPTIPVRPATANRSYPVGWRSRVMPMYNDRPPSGLRSDRSSVPRNSVALRAG